MLPVLLHRSRVAASSCADVVVLGRRMSQSGAAVTWAPCELATLRSSRQQLQPERGGFKVAVQLLGTFENMGRVRASSKTGVLRGQMSDQLRHHRYKSQRLFAQLHTTLLSIRIL